MMFGFDTAIVQKRAPASTIVARSGMDKGILDTICFIIFE